MFRVHAFRVDLLQKHVDLAFQTAFLHIGPACPVLALADIFIQLIQLTAQFFICDADLIRGGSGLFQVAGHDRGIVLHLFQPDPDLFAFAEEYVDLIVFQFFFQTEIFSGCLRLLRQRSYLLLQL